MGVDLSDRRAPVVGVDLLPDGPSSTYGTGAAPDLAAMAATGVGVVRLFASWRAIEPQVGVYDDAALDRLADTVSEATGLGLESIVCLFGSASTGECAGPRWSGRRDLREDPYMLERADSYVATIAARLSSTAGPGAWQLADEAFLAGFRDARSLSVWVARATDALSEHDPDRPVALGADTEVLADLAGLDAGAAADRLSLAVAAPTPREAAMLAPGPGLAGPATHLTGFLGRLARRGLPLLVDGVAPAAVDLSLNEEAGLVRLGLAEALADGVAVAFAGRWRYARQAARVPFERAAGERLTGLVDASGTPAPALAEVASFAATARALDDLDLAPASERVAVLVPSSRRESVGSTAAMLDLRSSLASFVLAREAHLPVDVVREQDGLEGLAVLIVPAARRLTEPTWDMLTAFVQEGGTLVLSHGGGEVPDALRALTGVEYLGQAGPRDTLCCRVAQPMALGAAVSFEVPLAIESSAVLAPGRATVLAADGAGRPLITVHRFGQGRSYLLSAPLERAIGDLPHDEVPTPARNLVSSLYRAACEQASAAGPVDCDRAVVRTAVLEGARGPVLVAVNHAPVAITATMTWERPVSHVSVPGSAGSVDVGGRDFRVRIEPHGAVVMELAGS